MPQDMPPTGGYDHVQYKVIPSRPQTIPPQSQYPRVPSIFRPTSHHSTEPSTPI